MIDTMLHALMCAIGLYAIRIARRNGAEAAHQVAVARAWRETFRVYLDADLRGREDVKCSVAEVAAARADELDAEQMTRQRRGWWAR